MPDPDNTPQEIDDDRTDELARLLHEFITSLTFAAKERIVEHNQPLLLSNEADSALAALLFEYADDEQMRESLTLHRAILQQCREDGIRETFVRLRQRLGEQSSLDSLSTAELQARVDTIGEFITTESWQGARRYLDEHPELLDRHTDAIFGGLIESHTRREEVHVVRQLVVHRDLLRTVREMGPNAAFDRVSNPPDTLEVITENTIAVLTTQPGERAGWLETVRMSAVRAAELGSHQMSELLTAVEQLLIEGGSPAEAAARLTDEYAAAWTRITEVVSGGKLDA